MRAPLAVAALAAVALLAASARPAPAKIVFRLENLGTVDLREMVADLRRARVIFFGERHDSAEDHVAQRTLIQALHDSGVDLAIGMEMFRAREQPHLDLWVAGELDAPAFRAVYERNWNADYWDLYNDILIYARQERIPLVGLNIPREIVTRVARHGFDSLGDEDRSLLGIDSCEVPPRYEDLLRRVLGEKDKRPGTFRNFCQAQLAWDAAMARHIRDYLLRHPGRIMVVICGTYHAWRHGIPNQLDGIADFPMRVILPSSDRTHLNYEILLEDADYVWWQE